MQTVSTQSRLEIPCAYSDRVLESGPCKSHSGGCLAACLNLDSTPSPVLLVRNAIPAFNFLYTSDTEHPKPHPRSQLSSQPHPHHFICLGHDSRSADVCTVSFALPSQLLTSKTNRVQNTETFVNVEAVFFSQPWIKSSEDMSTPASNHYSILSLRTAFTYNKFAWELPCIYRPSKIVRL